LERAGWYLARQRDTSQAYDKHPLLPGDIVGLSAHRDGQDAKRYQENDVRAAVERAENAKRKQKP
jgi:hypothetical protein